MPIHPSGWIRGRSPSVTGSIERSAQMRYSGCAAICCGRPFVHIAGETRCCINILDQEYGSTEYLEPGCEVSSDEEQQFMQRYPDIIRDSDVVTISGSLPRGMSKDIYGRMTAIAKDMGKAVILDTSGEPLKQGIKSHPTMVKPNQDEIEQLFGIKIHNMQEVIRYAGKL